MQQSGVAWFRRKAACASESAPSVPDPAAGDLLHRLSAAAGLAGPAVAATLRPAVRFAVRRSPDETIALGASKFCGSPDLDPDAVLPTWITPAGIERSLSFYAQIDLAAAAAVAPAPLELPRSGLLSFFVDFNGDDDTGISGLYPWEASGSRVLYTPAETTLVRRTEVRGPADPAAFRPIGAWTWESVGIDMTDDEFERLDGFDVEYDSELRRDLPEGWSATGRHQLGGHARHIQHPVEEEVVQALAGCSSSTGRFDHALWKQVEEQVPDWRVLLQIDSDDALDVMWGDVGTLHWAARQLDIDAGRWAGGAFNFQCS